MNREDTRRLLDRIGVLKHVCDVDLLVFFARHPRTLLTSEQLAAWLGYELKQIAASLEMLLDAGLLTRTQNPTHAARMYILVLGDSTDDWVPPLLKLASTRAGPPGGTRGTLATGVEKHGRSCRTRCAPAADNDSPWPFVVRRPSDQTSKAEAG